MDQTLTPFAALLDPDPALTAVEGQRRASNLLPVRVSQSAMKWLALPEPPNGTADKLVVGVASWSKSDLALLDELDAFAASHPGVRVCVFDVDRIGGEFERFVPGIGEVVRTPVVGRWSAGVLVERGTGAAGREIAGRMAAQHAPASA
jgi:hypothetical protein